jgi:flagellar hook-basal body complex protein FliE
VSMSVPAIGSVSALTALGGASAAASTGASAFATALGGAVDNLQAMQANSDTLAITAVTGNLDDIHTATIAATRAEVSLELAAAVRNKAVDAFNEIMRMQA